MTTVRERVFEVIKEFVSPNLWDGLENSDDLHVDLDLDSLAFVELTLALESEFGVELTDDDTERLRNVGDVVKAFTPTTVTA